MLRLGQILIDRGFIAPSDLEAGLAAQASVGGLLGQTLIRLGALSETDLLSALSQQLGMAVVVSSDLPSAASVREAAERVHANPSWLFERETVIWFDESGEQLYVASRNPGDAALQDAMEQWSATPPICLLASQQDLELILEQLAKQQASASGGSAIEGSELARLRELAEEAPVIDFVNSVLTEAQTRRASDVHIEPFEDRFVVRFRIDGILQQWRTAPRTSFEAIASRIKLLSGMDIAERRLPQDGRQTIRVSGRDVDLRVSSFPSIWGESLVMRLLGKTRSLPELSALGVAADHGEQLAELVSKPNGVVLVTGPTGSGKTTTIYRLLMMLNDGVRKIITVEDPVEFELGGVVQMQVRADIGLTFASGLRSILRQDPDVILLGEIRDAETGKICVQAALTGHLVVSTLHTNSALAAIPRLLDLDVEEYLLADVLRGVIGQRLVRRLCGACRVPDAREHWQPIEDQLRDAGFLLGASAPAYHAPKGCEKCGHTGYQGRLGIYEVVVVDSEVATAIRNREPERALTERARQLGFRSLLEDGLLKARLGLTAITEISRVTTSA